MTEPAMIEPGAFLGVLGGGQLARMFGHAAHRLGYRVAVLDPDAQCPAASIADRMVCAPLDSRDAWAEMARTCAAVTIETENVPAAALWEIGRSVPVAPDHVALVIAQDRIGEKAFLAGMGIAIAPNVALSGGRVPAGNFSSLLPGILKVSRNGYDGKGQCSVKDEHELHKAFAQFGFVDCVLESRVPIAAELSVILACDGSGGMSTFPVPLNTHERGILDVSVVPAPLPQRTKSHAISIAKRIATRLAYRGVLCVEFFLLEDGSLLVNEIAPRPHNSGHFTLDACDTSQFEQQVRAMAGLPLGSTRLNRAAAMANLLGDLWKGGQPHWERALSAPGARLHLYGKSEAKSGRKMGHLTCLAPGPQAAAAAAVNMRAALARNELPAETGWRQ